MRTALIVVGMRNDFVHDALARSAAAQIAMANSTLLGRTLSENARQSSSASGAHRVCDRELPVFPPHAISATDGIALIDELAQRPSHLGISKCFCSAYNEADLDNSLRSDDSENITLVGQHADCWIHHTAYDAFMKGGGLVVSTDATTVFASEPNEQTEPHRQQALDYPRHCDGAPIERSLTVEQTKTALASSMHDRLHVSPTSGVDAVAVGHRVLPHAADCIIEAWAPTRGSCLAEALSALVETFALVPPRVPTRVVPLTTDSTANEDILVSLLEEVIFVLDVFSLVPVRFHLSEEDAGGVIGDMEVVDLGDATIIGPAPKAVSYHDLSMAQQEGAWRCHVLIDV